MTDARAAGQVPTCPHLATHTHDFVNNLHGVLDPARQQSPLAWDDTHGFWLTTRWQTASAVLKDWKTFSSTCGSQGTPETPKMPPIAVDPPLHREWRTMLNPFFNPAAVKVWAPDVVRVADELIDAMRAGGQADLVDGYSRPLPGRVFFGAVMGLPVDDVRQCQEWAEMVVGTSPHGGVMDGYAGLYGYVEALVEKRRAEPARDDVIGAVVAAQIDGQPADHVDICNTIMMLILGGLETVTNTLGLSLMHLARDAGLQDELRSHPERVPTAVDEFLRLYAPTIGLCRQATQDAEVDGVAVMAGDVLSVSFLAANHDPDAFADPHAFRAERSPMRHLAFGYGVHFCLGSHLARLELVTAITRLLEHTRRFEVVPGYQPQFRTAGVWTLSTVDVDVCW
jgi:cytochrome P450